MSRPRHTDQDVEKSIQRAEALGWEVRMARGHAWGILYYDHSGCRVAVYSTPRSGSDHARQIIRKVDNCPHFLPEPEPQGG